MAVEPMSTEPFSVAYGSARPSLFTPTASATTGNPWIPLDSNVSYLTNSCTTENKRAEATETKRMLPYSIENAPADVPPLFADLLCVVFSFVGGRRDLVAVSGVCTMWRFYANYQVEWSRLYLRGALLNTKLTRSLSIAAAGPSESSFVWSAEGRTRTEIMRHVQRHLLMGGGRQKSGGRSVTPAGGVSRSSDGGGGRRSGFTNCCMCSGPTESGGGIAHIPRFLILNCVVLGVMTGQGFAAWAMGVGDNALHSDAEVAVTVFFVELAIVIVAFIIGFGGTRYKHTGATILRGALTSLLVSCAIFTPLSLVGSRIASLRFIVDQGEVNVSSIAAIPPCSPIRASFSPPGVVGLPAPLSDDRWRAFPGNMSIDEAAAALSNATTSPARPLVASVSYVILAFAVWGTFEPSAFWDCSRARLPSDVVAVMLTEASGAADLRTVAQSGALSYRTAVPSTHYSGEEDSEGRPPFDGITPRYSPGVVSDEWYNAKGTNRWWRNTSTASGPNTQLINPKLPTTIAALNDKEERLLDGAAWPLVWVGTGLAGVSTLLELAHHMGCLGSQVAMSDGYLKPVVVVFVATIICVNPFTLCGFGIACIVKERPETSPTWLMCDRQAGIGMTSLGFALLVLIAVIACLLRRNWYGNDR